MSAFGTSTSVVNPNGGVKNTNQKSNGFGDSRRSGHSTNRKRGNTKFSSLSANSNNNRRFNEKGDHDRKKPSRFPKKDIKMEDTDLTINNDKSKPNGGPKPKNKLKVFTAAPSDEEIALTGTLFPNPEMFGFQHNNKVIPMRETPKYLLQQPRLLETPQFRQDQWDRNNQDKMNSMEEQSRGKDYQGLYEEFQKLREIERKKMESIGLVDAENTRKDLHDAISFSGTCLDMCPTFERVRRALENNVKALEKDPETKAISRDRAVKAFSRPAAGQPPPLPSDVRPPHILKNTLDYLVNNIVPQLPDAHSFIWDRTRSIRQDFTYQNSFGPEAIDCNERIVRIHLLSLHVMAGSDIEYSQQQELEQFNKALQTLIEIYQDVRNHGGYAPNEAEIRAYYLLSHLRDPELEREIQELPDEIFKDRNVQLALMFRKLISQNNLPGNSSVGALNLFSEFFKIVYSKETPFLMSCLLETQFNEIRFYALKAMARCYHTKGKAYPATSLQNLLGFETLEQLLKFVTYYEIDLIEDNGETLVDLFNKEKLESKYKLNSINEKPKLAQPYSRQIDYKIAGRQLQDFINCGHPNVDLKIRPSSAMKVIQSESKSFDTFNTAPKVMGFGGTPTGFGQPASSFGAPIQQDNASKSLSLSDFLKTNKIDYNNANNVQNTSKPVVDFAPKPTQSFSTSQDSMSFNTSNTTQTTHSGLLQPNTSVMTNQISHQNSNNELKPNFQTKINQENEKPKIAFSFNPPATTPVNTAPPIGLNTTKSDINKTPVVTNKEKPNFTFGTSTNSASIVAPAATPAPIIEKKPIPPQKTLLKDHPKYKSALNEILKEILEGTITGELSSLLPKLLKHENRKIERRKIIESLSEELFSAFISEITYQKSLEAQAIHHYDSKLKRKAIRNLIEVGTKLMDKQILKRKKLDELRNISFKYPRKRNLSSTSLSSMSSERINKIRRTWTENDSFNLDERQSEVRELWKPIDLKNFLVNCSRNVKVDIEEENVEMKFLLVVENWTASYSKWLNTKLSLKLNKESLVYENNLIGDKLSINISSIPNNDYLNKDVFSKIPFILFECGMVSNNSSYTNIQEKLIRDQKILKKLIDLSKKFGYYKVQFLILCWDTTNSNISEQEIRELLNLDDHLKNDVVLDIILCNMSAIQTDVNDLLVTGFKQLASQFKGELTARGLRKKIQAKSLKEAKKAKEKTPNLLDNLNFEKKEADLVNKAKNFKKYDYLSKHLQNSNVSNNTTNASLNSTMFMTADNRSAVSNSNLANDSTFLNLKSFANTTLGNDISVLTGFGNGVIEESTPSSSPRANKFTRPQPANIPKSLLELRRLTAEITAKYKKK